MPIGTILGSIFSNAAATVVDSVGNAFDKNFTSKEEKDAAKLEMVKEVNRNIEAMKAQVLTQYEAELKDMADARNREVLIATSANAPLINKIILPILAAFVTLGFFGILAYMLMETIPQENTQVLNIMLGSLGTAWIGIIFYYFGSSAGSAAKQKQIEKLTE